MVNDGVRMYKILMNTPFGFVFELENDSCYFAGDYDITINREFFGRQNTNVCAIFGMSADTEYSVHLAGNNWEIDFLIRTEKPRWVVDVRDYNAIGDGISDDTAAINIALYTAPTGAVVHIPPGEYLVSQILLKSGVDIYLAKDAVIKQSIERKNLAIIKGYQKSYDHQSAALNASWEGHPLDCYCSLIYGGDAKDIRIYGEGILDGNGDIGGFWENAKIKNIAFRPKNLLLVNCEDITLAGITSRNSASWNIHPLYTHNFRALALKIESDADSPNTDGLNPESCQDVEIIGCKFSVGDDCIAIKAGKFYMSQAHYKPCRNITIRNCHMERGHGAVVIGSEISCGVQNVYVSRCIFTETDRGLRIKTRRGRGELSVVSGIVFENVIMERCVHGFVVNMFYFCDPDGKSEYVRTKDKLPVDEYTPKIGDITLRSIKATEILGTAIFVYGLPESPVACLNVVDCKFEFAVERVLECPAMMEDFTVESPLDFYIENVEECFGI